MSPQSPKKKGFDDKIDDVLFKEGFSQAIEVAEHLEVSDGEEKNKDNKSPSR